MGESTVYRGEMRIYMDSHVKRILDGDVWFPHVNPGLAGDLAGKPRFPPCKSVYMGKADIPM